MQQRQMMAADVDALIVGAGVVGLAVAAKLARIGLQAMVVDTNRMFGTETSSRNSEVIHAGIYYADGSLKAKLCVRGRDLLYDYCATHGVPHRRIGKLIYARTADDSPRLDAIAAAAAAANVHDMVRLDRDMARWLEPALTCHEALLSPSTGIVDARALMATLLGEAEELGGHFIGQTRVTALSRRAGGWGVHINGDMEPALIAARVVNVAGLTADRLARATEGLCIEHVPKVHYARGHYFSYQGGVPFNRLIYPIPVPGGLGTHLTFDLAGAARFGPDVEWIDVLQYKVDPALASDFVTAARAIWAGIDPTRVVPAYSGIRPKLSGPGEPAADFRVDGPERHGLAGLVNLFGIESPGLTASLAIADLVATKLDLTEGC